MMDANDDSAKITGPPVHPSPASSSSGFGDEERKRGLEQSQCIECKESNFKRNRKDGGYEGEDESRQCHDEAMVGEFEVNQGARRISKRMCMTSALESCWTRTMRAESEDMSHIEQLKVGIGSTEEECWAKTGAELNGIDPRS